MIDTYLLHNILRQPVFQVVNFKDEVEILRKSCILSVLKQHVRRVRSDCLEATFPFLMINVDVVGGHRVCNLVKSSTEVDRASLILDLVKEASNHFRHRVQLNKELNPMLFLISHLSSRKDVVGSKRQGMKFQKMASLQKMVAICQIITSATCLALNFSTEAMACVFPTPCSSPSTPMNRCVLRRITR